MSIKRQAPSKASRSSGRTQGSSTRTAELEPEEERTLRMRYGLGVSDDHPLEQKHRGQPDLIAKLREIEARAFERTNRVADLKRIAGVTEEDEAKTPVRAKKPVKEKIVEKLKAKASKKTTSAKATATAKSSAAKKRR